MKLALSPIVIIALLAFSLVTVCADNITCDTSYVQAFAVGTVGAAGASAIDNNNPYGLYAQASGGWMPSFMGGGWFDGTMFTFYKEVDAPGTADCPITVTDYMQNISATCTAHACFVGPGTINGPSVWRAGDNVVLSSTPYPATHQTTDPVNNPNNPTQVITVGHESMLGWAYRPVTSQNFQPLGGTYIDSSSHISHCNVSSLAPGYYVIGVTASTPSGLAYGGTTPWSLAQTKRVHVLPPGPAVPNGCPTQ